MTVLERRTAPPSAPAEDHPLARATAAVRARDEHQVIELGRPEGETWFRLDALCHPGAIEEELAWVVGTGNEARPPDVAGSYLASWLDSCVLVPAATLLVLEGVLPDVTPSNLWLRRHASGRWYDRVAFERPVFTCTADHPAASHPDARVVARPIDLVHCLADDAVAYLAPLFSAVRSAAPYGLRGMWGSLADDLSGGLLWITRRDDGDPREQRQVWQAAGEILDAIAERAPLLRVRPTPVEVTWSRGTTLCCRRSTCCLYHKTAEAAAAAAEDRYCASCPLRDAAEQRIRWSQWLDSTAPTVDGLPALD